MSQSKPIRVKAVKPCAGGKSKVHLKPVQIGPSITRQPTGRQAAAAVATSLRCGCNLSGS